MKLLEIHEPLFQYVARLKRANRSGVQPEYGRVRSDIQGLLDDLRRMASADVRVANQVSRLELPIIFFVDNLVCSSQLTIAAKWGEQRLAMARNELAGDERFFEFLEADLHDPGDEASERLAIYHVCLGLGFTGMYVGQPDRLRSYADHIFPRVRQWMDTDNRARIVDDAYKFTDKRILTEPPSRKIVLVTVAFVGFLLAAAVLYAGLYLNATDDLNQAVKRINAEAAGAPAK